MAYAIFSIVLGTIAVFVTAHILPGVSVAGWGTSLIVAVVLAVLNAFIRPLIFLLTLPINILTLGLFTLVIMACLVMLVSSIVPGFHVDGFWWALAFALVLAIVNYFLTSLAL